MPIALLLAILTGGIVMHDMVPIKQHPFLVMSEFLQAFLILQATTSIPFVCNA